MESILYELMEHECVYELKERLTQENKNLDIQDLETEKEKLEAILDDDGKKILGRYALALENWFDYLNYNACIEILNKAVKIGMELQKAFDNFAD